MLLILGCCLALGSAAYTSGQSKAQPSRLDYIRLQAQADYGGQYYDKAGKGYVVKVRAIPPDTIRVCLVTVGIDDTRGKLQATRIAEAIYRDWPLEHWLKIEVKAERGE